MSLSKGNVFRIKRKILGLGNGDYDNSDKRCDDIVNMLYGRI